MKQSRSPRISTICEPIPRSRCGRRIPIVSRRRPNRLPQPSANHSSRRWAGPKKGSGHRRPRPSSCWRRGRASGVVADRNRGLCCLWLADHEAAVAALRRYIARTKPTTDTVDLEALCQKIEPPSRHDLVGFDRLSWPIRNRDGLLAALRADPAIAEGLSLDRSIRTIRSLLRWSVFCSLIVPPSRPSPASPGRTFRWSMARCLSIRTSSSSKPSMTAGSIAWSIGSRPLRARRFRRPIPGPRSSGMSPGMSWPWPGDGMSRPGSLEEEIDRLRREQAAYMISEVWPKTPHPSLRRRTPLQAGQAGDRETFLRGRIRRMEAPHDEPDELLDWNELRSKLHLNPEPPIDPETVEIDQLHLSRLGSGPDRPAGRRPPAGVLSPGGEVGAPPRAETRRPG